MKNSSFFHTLKEGMRNYFTLFKFFNGTFHTYKRDFSSKYLRLYKWKLHGGGGGDGAGGGVSKGSHFANTLIFL